MRIEGQTCISSYHACRCHARIHDWFKQHFRAHRQQHLHSSHFDYPHATFSTVARTSYNNPLPRHQACQNQVCACEIRVQNRTKSRGSWSLSRGRRGSFDGLIGLGLSRRMCRVRVGPSIVQGSRLCVHDDGRGRGHDRQQEGHRVLDRDRHW
jgi:hypothetical protein